MKNATPLRLSVPLTVAAVMVLLALVLIRQSTGTDRAVAAAVPDGPTISADGTLTYPAAWRAKVADLSQRAVACVVANGSKRVVNDGDVSYPNTSDGAAYKACAAILAENEALNTSAELAALDRRAIALTQSFRACIGQDDISPPGLVRASRAGRNLARCATDANAIP